MKDSLRINFEFASAVPTSTTSSRDTVKQFMTPGGIPASRAMAHRAREDKGVSSEGLMTTVHPAAKAAPIWLF